MPRLVAAVYVQDPFSHEELILLPGEEPPPELARLITNPEAWDVFPGGRAAEETVAVEEVEVVETETVVSESAAVVGGEPKKPSPRRGRSSATS
jgi:hypothetical protein